MLPFTGVYSGICGSGPAPKATDIVADCNSCKLAAAAATGRYASISRPHGPNLFVNRYFEVYVHVCALFAPTH